jgi:hypothetical protein
VFFTATREAFIDAVSIHFKWNQKQLLVGSPISSRGSSEWVDSYPHILMNRSGGIDRAWEANSPGSMPGCRFSLPHPTDSLRFSSLQPSISPF